MLFGIMLLFYTLSFAGNGFVYDASTGEPIENARITFHDNVIYSAKDGSFNLDVPKITAQYEFNLLPNGQILFFNNEAVSKVSIFDIKGRQIDVQTPTNLSDGWWSSQVPSFLSAGVYFINYSNKTRKHYLHNIDQSANINIHAIKERFNKIRTSKSDSIFLSMPGYKNKGVAISNNMGIKLYPVDESSSKAVVGNKVIAEREVYFRYSQPNRIYIIQKILTGDNKAIIKSACGKITCSEDLVKMEQDEQLSENRLFGNVNRNLYSSVNGMRKASKSGIKAVVRLKSTPIKYLDKTKTNLNALKKNSLLISKAEPVSCIAAIKSKYKINDVTVQGNDVFTCSLTKEQIDNMRFDNEIVAINEDKKKEPTYYISTLTKSAYNPLGQMPTNAMGYGVRAATAEGGLSQQLFNCIGTLKPENIWMGYNNEDVHSDWCFKCLQNTAPKSILYHVFGYYGAYSVHILNNGIQTASISLYDEEDETDYDIRLMDDMAYKYPFPVFCLPAGNNNKDEYRTVTWLSYNSIITGSSRQVYEKNFIMSPYSSWQNPPPRYGLCCFENTDSDPNDSCSGDRELPHVVTPGHSPDNKVMGDPCYGPPYGVSGTSFSAPVLSGLAACVISANSRMVAWPEKVRVALALTAHNVEEGHWSANVDQKDGTGTVSGTDAVKFARNHVSVNPSATQSNPQVNGLAAGSIYRSTKGPLKFWIKIPTKIPAGKHLRVVLTWNSNPLLNKPVNALSDLDMHFNNYQEYSSSWDSNYEILDVPANSVVPGKVYPLTVLVWNKRIPTDCPIDFFYYAVGWTWVTSKSK